MENIANDDFLIMCWFSGQSLESDAILNEINNSIQEQCTDSTQKHAPHIHIWVAFKTRFNYNDKEGTVEHNKSFYLKTAVIPYAPRTLMSSIAFGIYLFDGTLQIMDPFCAVFLLCSSIMRTMERL